MPRYRRSPADAEEKAIVGRPSILVITGIAADPTPVSETGLNHYDRHVNTATSGATTSDN